MFAASWKTLTPSAILIVAYVCLSERLIQPTK